MKSSLEEYLSSVRVRGLQVLSRGLSPNLTRALDELESQGFSERGIYLLKAIQSAIACDPGAIRVTILKARRSVDYRFFRVPVPFEQLPQRLGDLEDCHAAVGNLRLALLSASRSAEARWRLVTREQGFEVRVAPGECSVQPVGPGGPGEVNSCHFETRLPGQTNDLLWGLRERTECHTIVSRACRYAPVAVFLDGVLVNDPSLPPGPYRARRFVLGQKPCGNLMAVVGPAGRDSRQYRLNGADVPGFPPGKNGLTELCTVAEGDELYPPAEWRLGRSGASARFGAVLPFGWEELYLEPEPFAPLGDRTQALLCHAAFLLPQRASGPGRLQVIHQGVSLEPVEADLGYPGAVAMLALSEVETDVSKMVPVNYGHLVTYAREHVAELLD